jgi:hypothetical protein
MVIARERYLDKTSDLHVTISLTTRTGVMHSLLSNAPESAREVVSDILVDALDRIEQQLKPHTPRHAVHP